MVAGITALSGVMYLIATMFSYPSVIRENTKEELLTKVVPVCSERVIDELKIYDESGYSFYDKKIQNIIKNEFYDCIADKYPE